MNNSSSDKEAIDGPAASFGLKGGGFDLLTASDQFSETARTALRDFATTTTGGRRDFPGGISFGYDKVVTGGWILVRITPGPKDGVNRSTKRFDAIYIESESIALDRLLHPAAWQEVPTVPGETISLTPADPPAGAEALLLTQHRPSQSSSENDANLRSGEIESTKASSQFHSITNFRQTKPLKKDLNTYAALSTCILLGCVLGGIATWLYRQQEINRQHLAASASMNLLSKKLTSLYELAYPEDIADQDPDLMIDDFGRLKRFIERSRSEQDRIGQLPGENSKLQEERTSTKAVSGSPPVLPSTLQDTQREVKQLEKDLKDCVSSFATLRDQVKTVERSLDTLQKSFPHGIELSPQGASDEEPSLKFRR